jgi:hypothetical protein
VIFDVLWIALGLVFGLVFGLVLLGWAVIRYQLRETERGDPEDRK